jgi:uncharacterized protein DUF4214
MRRLISTLIALSMLLALGAPAFVSFGQKATPDAPPDRASQPPIDPTQDPSQPGHAILHKMPKDARIGSTPERIAAWNNLSAADKARAGKILHDAVAGARQNQDLKKRQNDDLPSSLNLSFSNKDRSRNLRPAHLQKSGDANLTLALKLKGKDRYLTLASTKAPTNVTILKDSYKRRGTQRAHALKRALSPPFDCSRAPEQFVRTFYEGALARPPHADELTYWMDTLATAQSNSTTLAAAQSLGNTLFQSQEYANRGRSNVNFVYDCYKAWLQREPDQSGWDFWTNQADVNGQPAVLQAFVVCGELSDHVGELCNVATYDGDQDSTVDQFENQVADAFTPYYHVSAYDPDQFATFNDSTSAPESIKQLFGTTPISHFRVHKEGFAYDANNNTVGVLRIDYLTFWNYDSGLVSGGSCAWNLFGLDDVLAALDGHYLDHERSAMLVAAPISNGDYNLDPANYSIYNIFTTGHEFTLTDQSTWYSYFNNPVPAYNHIELFLSRSKHATYVFNPDYLPLTPWYIIDGTYEALWLAYIYDEIPWWLYYALLAAADNVFFSCLTERFTEQGGQYALVRTAVGEPGVPINHSSYIAVSTINTQLTTSYFH